MYGEKLGHITKLTNLFLVEGSPVMHGCGFADNFPDLDETSCHNFGTWNWFKHIEVLEQYVLLFKNKDDANNTGFMYQHDGCVPHLAEKVTALVEACNFEFLSWPAQSLGIKPIENI